tara:strand:- start:142 stop:444 length:303 start_codon:yes stop_codon:yes gene_type:complete
MSTQDILNKLQNENPEAILWTGCDEALIGVGGAFGEPQVAVYSYSKLLDHFIAEFSADGNVEEDEDIEEVFTQAVEWISVNLEGAYLGPHTPIIVDDYEY